MRWLATIDALVERSESALRDDARQPLADFVELVHIWRKRTDLVAASGDTSLVDVLLLDAFVLARVLPEGVSRVVDIGAGAGAPAIPLALLRPELQLTLVEPRRRRVVFMRTALGSLGLAERVRVIEGRDSAVEERFDFAYSRATFEPAEWLPIGARLAPQVGLLLAGGPVPSTFLRQVHEEAYTTFDGVPRRLVCFAEPFH